MLCVRARSNTRARAVNERERAQRSSRRRNVQGCGQVGCRVGAKIERKRGGGVSVLKKTYLKGNFWLKLLSFGFIDFCFLEGRSFVISVASL